METGKLRERVAFEARATVANDGAGNTLGDWVKQFDRAAGYSFPRDGSESVIAARLAGVEPITIETRSDVQTRAVDTAMRIRDLRTSKIYNIRSAQADAARSRVRFFCEAGVADG